MAAKVLDAGDGKLVISGSNSEEVSAELARYISRGAKVITEVKALGTSWIGACTLPSLGQADNTQSLSIRDFEPAAKIDEGPCKVEELGLKRIVRGPSKALVEAKCEELKRFGAAVELPPEQEGSEWVAVLDTGGPQNTGFKW